MKDEETCLGGGGGRGGQRALDGFQMSNEMDPVQTEEPFLLC